MPAEALKKPDEAAMFRILARHPYSPEGVILRLAWQEGLSRKELNELTWDQVDLDGGSLLLPDRTVPLEPSVVDCLRERYVRYRKLSNRVLIADRGKKPMTPENVSRSGEDCLGQRGTGRLPERPAPGLDRPPDQIQRLGLCRPCQRHGRGQSPGHFPRRPLGGRPPAGRPANRRRRYGIQPLAHRPAGGQFHRGPCHLDVLEAPDASRGRSSP